MADSDFEGEFTFLCYEICKVMFQKLLKGNIYFQDASFMFRKSNVHDADIYKRLRYLHTYSIEIYPCILKTSQNELKYK